MLLSRMPPMDRIRSGCRQARQRRPGLRGFLVALPPGALRSVTLIFLGPPMICALPVEPRDAAAVARALGRLLADAALQQALRAQGLERALAFTGERGYAAAMRRAWAAS